VKRADPPLDRLAHVLADPMRLRVLDLLSMGRPAEPCCSPRNPDKPRAVCACDLRPALGDIAASKLAYHLKELRKAGLVAEERKGKWVYYTLDAPALERFTRRLLRRFLGERAAAGPTAAARTRTRPTTSCCDGSAPDRPAKRPR